MDTLPLFPVGSRASHFPAPGGDEARAMTVISGRKCYELWTNYSPHGSSARTFLDYFLSMEVWRSDVCLLRWKHETTKSSGFSIIRLLASVPRTSETESSLWHTPTAHNAKEGAYPAEYRLNSPTLTAEASVGKPAKLWQTSVTPTPGKLNPEWVEWLMNFPIGWTEVDQMPMKSGKRSLPESQESQPDSPTELHD